MVDCEPKTGHLASLDLDEDVFAVEQPHQEQPQSNEADGEQERGIHWASQ
jgi:hypothetical protein